MSAVFPTVKIELDTFGDVELVPSPGAAIRIARHFGGFAEAHKKLLALDVDAFIAIIQLGGAINDRKAIETPVFSTGIINLLEPVMEYVALLSNGGKKVSEKSEDKDAGKGGK